MNKIKIFENTNYFQLESNINEWLKNQNDNNFMILSTQLQKSTYNEQGFTDKYCSSIQITEYTIIIHYQTIQDEQNEH